MNLLQICLVPGLVFLATNIALAQPPGAPQSPPAVSPWINLNRGGGNLAQNYYGQVRPQFQTNNAIQNLQQFDAYAQMAINEQAQQQQQQNAPLTTGHVATYGNYSHYYPRLTNFTGRMGGN